MVTSGRLSTNRDFQLFWTSQALSTLGSSMSLIAYPLLVLSMGGSPAQVGGVATCALVTRLLLRLPAGHFADRWDRRWVMLSTDLIRMCAMGGVPMAAAFGFLGYPLLLAVAAIEGAASAMFAPASTIAVRDIVPQPHLAKALARSQGATAAASMAGPFLGGAVYAIDPILPFTVDAASYAVSALLVLRISRSSVPSIAATADRRTTAGIRWLAGQPMLLRTLLFATAINFVGTAAEVAFVVALTRRGTASTGIGLVMACAGIGAVLGSIAAPWIMKRMPAGKLLLGIGVLWTCGLAALSGTSDPWILGPVLVLLMLLSPPAGILLGETMISGTPRELLGRVSTVANMFAGGLASAGPLLAGVILQGAGVPATWLTLAALAAAVTVVSAPMLRVKQPASPVETAGAPTQAVAS